MFDGRQFLVVAKSLASPTQDGRAPTDAAQRTAVGRAYYACFHVLRPLVSKPEGWSRVEKRGKKVYLSHRQMRRLVSKKFSQDVADLLDSLVVLREHADYHNWRPSSGIPGPPPS